MGKGRPNSLKGGTQHGKGNSMGDIVNHGQGKGEKGEEIDLDGLL